ncbi:MAG: hypothetical protein JSU00_01630 [Acidobacteria bacterium]|nr:hypothetical protein [Acidobacteriota bacterium]
MRRKLMALNLALIAVLGLVANRFFEVRTAAREREAAMLGKKIAPKSYPPLPALPLIAPMAAANYLDVAQHMLMARDRNPNVIIDPDPPKQKPPMPPMPVIQGLMSLGEPSIIMSERPGAVQRTYHAGEKVGPFTLVSFNSDKVVLDWDGEKLERNFDDLVEKSAPPQAGVAPGVSGGSSAPAPPPAMEAKGPGGDIGGGYHGCQANDSTPSGTVRDGLRKVEIVTPFGKSCRWEPVR